MERAKLIPAALLAAIAIGFLFTSVRSSTVASESNGGLVIVPAGKPSPAPDWTLADARTGQNVHLRDEARRRPVVFSFWATWCGPCRQELPHFQRVFERYQGRVAFYGVDNSDAPQSMTAFAAQQGWTFPLLADTRSEAATRYGVESIPLLVVVDTSGNIRAVSHGYDPSADLEGGLSRLLDTLLAEKPPPTKAGEKI